MATFRLTITESIDRKYSKEIIKFCCLPFENLLMAYSLTLMPDGSGFNLMQKTLRFCPFCGEKVIIDMVRRLPPGYKEIKP